ncbi:hypothetical protein PGS62_03990 [Yersinia rochesterensis]|uniref:hypothetical protein n=1 Tax=Yersinia TaxID=629 RepID=UPI00223ED714|nr:MULTISPECIES: hypothetical protein [Yersinia]MDA5543109.1 hypothetical protein [Yersinia rochesterensis]UZM75780.1 hypothetical protein OP863_03660 [Yersinia sp. SCPM-O-B-9106 (C-191)]
MKINHALLIIIYTVISIKIVHSRLVEPKYQSNKESFSQYQARHCQWESRHSCKTVPEDQGKSPLKTGGEVALEIGLGILSGGPTPQPKGFKFRVPGVKLTAAKISPPKVPRTPSIQGSGENIPLLTGSHKPKTSGMLERVNGKVGYLLGDTRPPTLGDEPIGAESSGSSSPWLINTDLPFTEEEIALGEEIGAAAATELHIITRVESIDESNFDMVKEEIESIYSKKTLDRNQLDIEEEINSYNRIPLNDEVSFREYYALRNYKEIGYVGMNKAMRTGDVTPDVEIEINEFYRTLDKFSDINIAAREQGHIATDENSTISQVFRGEIRNRAEFLAKIKPGKKIEVDAFFSTTSNEKVIMDFNSNDLSGDDANIRYTIKYQHGRTNSTNISRILNELEEERIFLPRSRFYIVEVIEEDDGETIEVRMFAIAERPPQQPMQVN